MTAVYRATIPYGVPHPLGRGVVQRGELQPRRDSRGRLLCGIVGAGDPVRDPIGRRAPYGKVLALDDTPSGLVATVDLGATAARPIVEHLRRGIGPYSLEPIRARGQLLGFEVTGIESWASAELRPADAPRLERTIPAPMPPRPDVNLAPFPSPLLWGR